METKRTPTKLGGRLSTKGAEPELWLQRILVPVDFCAASAVALRYAAALAKGRGAVITVLHVLQLSIAGEERGIPRTQLLNEMCEETEKRLHELVESVCGREVACECVLKVGKPSDEIVGVAREKAADLMVLPANEHVGLLRWLRPHTAGRVLRNAPCPVLVVRATQQPFVWHLRHREHGDGFIGDSRGG
ncbi:MAG: universal stress protein [Verrucomicrobia bacterium]|nr:universal stress protein [Verrucomicrobiota bacterium]